MLEEEGALRTVAAVIKRIKVAVEIHFVCILIFLKPPQFMVERLKLANGNLFVNKFNLIFNTNILPSPGK